MVHNRYYRSNSFLDNFKMDKSRNVVCFAGLAATGKNMSLFINSVIPGVQTKPHRTKPHTDRTPQDKTPLDKTPLTTGQNPTSFIMYKWIPHNFFNAILH